MSTRSYRLCLRIDNGVERHYAVRPLAAADLETPFLCGYALTERTQNSHPTYHVRLAADGIVNCSCPQWNKAETCKHADALVAAGLLPVRLVEVLAATRHLLDLAEAKIAAMPKPRSRKKKTDN